MRKLLFFTFMFTCFYSFGQEQKIRFEYDASGNQISRTLCLMCNLKEGLNKDLTELKETDYSKFSSQDDFSYYPNPVKEELYLKWTITEGNYIQNLTLFNLNGALLKKFDINESLNNLNITFVDYPKGVYIIELVYNNGDIKTVKIIKQYK